MSKRILALLISLFLCLAVGCSGEEERLSVDVGEDATSSTQEKEEETEYVNGFAVNPLTGVADLKAGKEKDRPVAITINNISTAQPVQTGLSKADVVYEMPVEGGITRLVALYQDISAVEKIGTVRSARYAFIDFALGHNAMYVHHGQEEVYAKQHLKDIDSIVLGTSNGGARISNGLSSEHTLYAYGDKVWKTLDKEFDTEDKSNKKWLNFTDEEIKFEQIANSVKVPFSNSYNTIFKYDEATGLYTRYFNNTLRTDYYTKDTTTVKNVFLISTDIYLKNGIPMTELNSGNGYYFVNGTYSLITWSKGNSKDSLVFKDLAGNELKVEAGNSWICVADKDDTFPVME